MRPPGRAAAGVSVSSGGPVSLWASSFDRRRSVMPLNQSQLAAAVAERADLSRAEAKRALVALEGVVLGEINKAEKVRIGNLVQLAVRVKPATKSRKGR